MQTAIFREHYGTLKDLDSGGDVVFCDGVLLKDGIDEDKAEELTERVLRKNHAWMFGSNTLEFEYLGTTGKTVEAEPVGAKWKQIREITPSTVDFAEHTKMF